MYIVHVNLKIVVPTIINIISEEKVIVTTKEVHCKLIQCYMYKTTPNVYVISN